MVFIPPTPEQVHAYAHEIGFTNLDAARFVDYYEMIGWKVSGKTPMKNWKAAIRYWRSNDRDRSKIPLRPASLGALQLQLDKVEEEIRSILYIGGSAYRTIPTGDKRIRYEFLLKQRATLRLQIEGLP